MRFGALFSIVGLVLLVSAGCGREAVSLGDSGPARPPEEILADAEKGDVAAQRTMGRLYLSGADPRLERDYAEAYKWARKAAEQGDAESMLRVGLMLAQGTGVGQDLAEATRWYRAAALEGSLHAQSRLAAAYTDGLGVEQDFEEAVRWYRIAAEQDLSEAQVKLGIMYERGRGVPQDYVTAIEWYHEAARLWNSDALLILGRLHAQGTGVEQDCVEATKWFSVASRVGDTRAQEGIDFCSQQLTEEQLAQGRARGERWHPRELDSPAAKQGAAD